MKETAIFLHSITRNVSSHPRLPLTSHGKIMSASEKVIPKYVTFSFSSSRITDTKKGGAEQRIVGWEQSLKRFYQREQKGG